MNLIIIKVTVPTGYQRINSLFKVGRVVTMFSDTKIISTLLRERFKCINY